MEPCALYTAMAAFVLLPTLCAAFAARVARRQVKASGQERAHLELYATKILFAQTLVPFLQIPQVLRSVTVPPGKFLSLWSFVGVTLLPCLAVALCVSCILLLARYGRGAGRVALPLLNILDLSVSACLLLCNFAIA